METGDAFCLRLLNDPMKREVLEWLNSGKEKGYTLGELPTTIESIRLAEQIYDAGATYVTAVEINQGINGSQQNTGRLVITLPEDPQARRDVFRWNEQSAADLGFDADEDTGQRYLFVMLD